jgi:uncharacterized 2Fe-2S/4Fe-4S cluster protein (DUF4445 family)
MLPDIPIDNIQQVGNAAGAGAKLALISRKKREEVRALVKYVKYIELAGDPSFTKMLTKAMYFE